MASCTPQSNMSANDKGDNEVKQWTVHRSPGIYLTAEEKQNFFKGVFYHSLSGSPYILRAIKSDRSLDLDKTCSTEKEGKGKSGLEIFNM